jgi:hypothetical protein
MPQRHLIVPALAALLLAASVGTAAGQQQSTPGVAQEVLARGHTDQADVVDGPADVYIGSVQLLPGASYAGWHTHPGPVWVVVSTGELAVYGPDTCRTVYAAGSAYLAEPATAYDLRNESSAPTLLFFSGVIPAGQPPTVQAAAPATTSSQ